MKKINFKTGEIRDSTITEEINHHVSRVLDLNRQISRMAALTDGRKQRRLPSLRRSRSDEIATLHKLIDDLPKAMAK